MSEQPKQRLFVGMELPEAARAAIVERARPLRDIEGFRWVPTENLHLTLAFLGWMEAGAEEVVGTRLAAAAASASPFTLRVGGPGRFPERGKVRVLWVGLDDSGDALAGLAERVQASLARLFEPDARPFRAHVTVARARQPVAVRLPEPVPSPDVDLAVIAITLFRSHLGGEHVRYEVLRRWALGAQPSAIP
jgi:2'-5' RNA ligase